MGVGDIIEFKLDYEFNGKVYKKGHRFKIIGESYRGFDIRDDEGNEIHETLFIQDMFISVSDRRDEKIKKLGL